VLARRLATVFSAILYPSIASAHGEGIVLFYMTILGLLAGLFGLVAGGISAWRNWHPIRSFIGALSLFVVLTTAPGLFGEEVNITVALGAVLLAVAVAIIPAGVGHALGRKFVGFRLRRRLEPTQGGDV
jgi:hypothetical protein